MIFHAAGAQRYCLMFLFYASRSQLSGNFICCIWLRILILHPRDRAAIHFEKNSFGNIFFYIFLFRLPFWTFLAPKLYSYLITALFLYFLRIIIIKFLRAFFQNPRNITTYALINFTNIQKPERRTIVSLNPIY